MGYFCCTILVARGRHIRNCRKNEAKSTSPIKGRVQSVSIGHFSQTHFSRKKIPAGGEGISAHAEQKGLKTHTKEAHAMKKQWEARLVEKDLAEMLESYRNMNAGDGDE